MDMAIMSSNKWILDLSLTWSVFPGPVTLRYRLLQACKHLVQPIKHVAKYIEVHGFYIRGISENPYLGMYKLLIS